MQKECSCMPRLKDIELSKLHVASSRAPDIASISKQNEAETIHRLESEVQKSKNTAIALKKDKEQSITTWKQHCKQAEHQAKQYEKESEHAKGKISKLEVDIYRLNKQQASLESQLRARNEQVGVLVSIPKPHSRYAKCRPKCHAPLLA